MSVDLRALLSEADSLIDAYPAGYVEWGRWATLRTSEERQALREVWDATPIAKELAPGERLAGKPIATETLLGLQLLLQEFKDTCRITWDREERPAQGPPASDPGYIA